MQGGLHTNQCIKPSRYVIQYDAKTLGQVFQLACGSRFENVKPSEKYKAQQERFPRYGCANQRDQLTGDFVDHDKLRIFDSGSASDTCARGNADDNNHERERRCDPDL